MLLYICSEIISLAYQINMPLEQTFVIGILYRKGEVNKIIKNRDLYSQRHKVWRVDDYNWRITHAMLLYQKGIVAMDEIIVKLVFV